MMVIYKTESQLTMKHRTTMLRQKKFVRFFTYSPSLLTADNVKNDMHTKMFIKTDEEIERIEN